MSSSLFLQICHELCWFQICLKYQMPSLNYLLSLDFLFLPECPFSMTLLILFSNEVLGFWNVKFKQLIFPYFFFSFHFLCYISSLTLRASVLRLPKFFAVFLFVCFCFVAVVPIILFIYLIAFQLRYNGVSLQTHFEQEPQPLFHSVFPLKSPGKTPVMETPNVYCHKILKIFSSSNSEDLSWVLVGKSSIFTHIPHNRFLNTFPISLSIEPYKFYSSSRKTQNLFTEKIVSSFLPWNLQIYLYYHSLFFCFFLILSSVPDYLCPGGLPLV